MNRPGDQGFWDALPSWKVESMAARTRAWAALRWAQQAQMEHASIASFSKFSLQLVGLGAPAALIARCHEAALDEVHHARMAFALASRLRGEPLGPGPLSVAGERLSEPVLAVVAAETVRDGCINESLAAAEARAAEAEAHHHPIALALRTVARDEQAHAELAWTFVGWAVSVGGEPTRAAVRVAFEQAEAEGPVGEGTAEFHAGLGHLSPERAAQVRRNTFAELILPAARALMG